MSVLAHPCFGQVSCGEYGRIHLPVAPKCNISCAFCDKKYDCVSESRPGVTSKVISPKEALEETIKAVEFNPKITVAGIAGPGDSLANRETFETLRLIKKDLPNQVLCISTNGLLLPESVDELADIGLDTLTVTVNAASVDTARKIYESISYKGENLPLDEGLALLLNNQSKGIKKAFLAGITVKINTVLIPGINDCDIEEIARNSHILGASIHNIIPMIPCGRMADRKAPSKDELQKAQYISEMYINNFYGCQKCRADACGVI